MSLKNRLNRTPFRDANIIREQDLRIVLVIFAEIITPELVSEELWILMLKL